MTTARIRLALADFAAHWGIDESSVADWVPCGGGYRHPSATVTTPHWVGRFVRIGEGVSVGVRVRIGDGAWFGDRVVVDHNFHIGEFTDIGRRARIGDDVRIGAGVSLGDHVFVGDRACIHEAVRIGEWVMIGRDVHIGNDARIADDARIGDSASIRSKVYIIHQARIGPGWDIIDPHRLYMSQPCGYEFEPITVYRDDAGTLLACTGCFDGTLDELETKMRAKHGSDCYGVSYARVIAMARAALTAGGDA